MNESSSKAEDDPKAKLALSGRGIALCVGESFLVGLSYLLGFIIADKLGLSRPIPTLSISELILMSMGALFAYAFVFVFLKGYQSNFRHKVKVAETIKNISLAYIMHLSILLLVKDQGFSSVRAAIGMAYLAGCLGILGFRFLIRSLIPDPACEGKKRFILKGMGNPAFAKIAPNQPNRLKSYVHNSMSDDKLEEKVLDGAPAKR